MCPANPLSRRTEVVADTKAQAIVAALEPPVPKKKSHKCRIL